MLILLCVCYRFINGDVLNKINKIIRTLQPPHLYSNNINNTAVYVETTTEFFLPEIIVNRNVPQISNYYDYNQNHYVPPYPENNLPEIIANDDVPLVSNAYLPPSPPLTETNEISNNDYKINNMYLPPSDTQLQSNDDPINIPIPNNNNNYYLPPHQNTKDRKLKPNDHNQNLPLLIEINELRCLSNQNGFFKALLTIRNGVEIFPIIEHDSNDHQRCALKYTQSKIEINIDIEQFQKCQVIQCSNDGKYLCMKIRFPQIKGMRLVNDAVLTLQCKIQDRIVAKTHAFRLGVVKERFSFFILF